MNRLTNSVNQEDIEENIMTEEDKEIIHDELDIEDNIRKLTDNSNTLEKEINNLLELFENNRNKLVEYKYTYPHEKIATTNEDINKIFEDDLLNSTDMGEKEKVMVNNILHKLYISDNINIKKKGKSWETKKIKGWSKTDRLEFILAFVDEICPSTFFK